MARFTLAIALSFVPGMLWACEIASYEPGYVVPPASFGADCSFTVRGPLTLYTDITGTAAVNIGGGRIGQRVTRGMACGYAEEIWIVDCNSAEMIGIVGQPSGGVADNRKADLLYPPQGALRLSAETTVPDIANIAQREGYDHWTNIIQRLRETHRASHPELARLSQLDAACGCRIFYPDSALATQ